MIELIQCVVSRVLNTFPWIMALIFLALAAFFALLGNGFMALGALAILAFMFAVNIAVAIGECLASGNAPVGGAAPGAAQQPLVATTCPEAQAALNQANAAANAARAAFDQQVEAVGRARRRLRNALNAAVGLAGMLALALLNPFGWGGVAALAAALAVAVALVARRSAALARAERLLSALLDALAAAQTAVAAAQALVDALCGGGTTPSTSTPGVKLNFALLNG